VDRKGIIRSVIFGGPMSEAVVQTKIEALLQLDFIHFVDKNEEAE
jgi:hypothetical protein